MRDKIEQWIIKQAEWIVNFIKESSKNCPNETKF